MFCNGCKVQIENSVKSGFMSIFNTLRINRQDTFSGIFFKAHFSLKSFIYVLICCFNNFCFDPKFSDIYTMQNKFSNCYVWVNQSTSDLAFHSRA